MSLPFVVADPEVQANFDALEARLQGLVAWAAAESPLRVIRGNVAANGSILAGTDFSVTKGTPGVYTITFDSTFSAVPSGTALGDISVGVRAPSQDTFPTVSAWEIRILDQSFTHVDGAFSFTVIGPA